MMKKTGSTKYYNPRKNKKHIFFFNVLPVALAAAVLLGITGNNAFHSVEATAKTSLPNIETKKTQLSSTGGSFHILEVTPKKDNPLYMTTAGGNTVVATSGEGDANLANLDAVTGNFGYLIAGQEPINFNETLKNFGANLKAGDSSKYVDSNKLLDGRALFNARTSWAHNYLNALRNAGIASEDEDGAPLKLTKASDDSYYQELKPWDKDVDGEKTIDLGSTETVYVKGTLTQNLTGGSFSPSASSYTVSQNGGYVQNIDSLNPLFQVSDDSITEEEVPDYVFYKPQFTEVDLSDITVDTVKDYLYPAAHTGFPLIFSKTEDSDQISFDQLATGDFDDFLTTDQKTLDKVLKQHTFSDSKTYYVITDLAEDPVIGSSVGKDGNKTLEDLASEGYYASELDIEIPFVSTDSLSKKGFDSSAKSFFTCNPNFVNYVGEGNGSYDLNFESESDDKDINAVIINYSTIRYVGGYTNNNWFLKNTLDFDNDDVKSLAKKVYVDCVEPEKVTEGKNSDGQSQNFESYDLVVMNSGLDLFSDKINYSSGNTYSENKDLGTLSAVLEKYLKDKGPVFADSSVLNNRNIKDLLSKKEDTGDYAFKYMDMSKANNTSKCPDGAVYRSVYIFRGKGEKAMASAYYNDKFESRYYTEDESAFKDVYDEITYENALRERKNPGTTDKLDVIVDEATSVRYIINYAKQRSTARKSTLKVLDIEPESVNATNNDDNYTYYNVSDGSAREVKNNNNLLSEQTAKNFKKNVIQKFLPDYKDKNIEVTTVSTRTLAGITDDITETYDLVYIGDNRGIRKKYRDQEMNRFSSGNKFSNSLVYYNIGDKYYVSNTNYVLLNGMLDKDYEEGDDTNDTYRNSGNDISVKKQKELISFIKQGFPVIVSDGLISDTSHDSVDNVNLQISNTIASYESISSDTGKLNIKVSPQFVKDNKVIQVKNSNGQVVDPSDLVKCHYKLYAKNSQELVAESDNGTFTLNQDQMNRYGSGSDNNSFYTIKLTSVTIGDKETALAQQASRDISVWFNNGGTDTKKAGIFNDVVSGVSQPISIPASKNTAISKVTVDNNTRLYKVLDTYMDRGNVMSSSLAASDGGSVESYASLSSPEIDMEEAPEQYSESGDHNVIGEYNGDKLIQSSKKLDFAFKIVNQTDLNPAVTTYTARVFADLNSDGIYDPGSEEITALTVKAGDKSGGSVLPTNLKGGVSKSSAQQYYLTAQLPESLQGAFSWKLIISENSDDPDVAIDDCPKDSYKGVSFVGLNDKTQKISIKILQLNSDKNYENNKENKNYRNSFAWAPYDLQQLMAHPDAHNGGQYVNWFGKELTSQFIKDYYDLSITTIKASDFDGFTSKHPNWADTYDMLILGFGDAYVGPGYNGLKKVEDFIDKGKAVLFCHDNSSYRNLNSTYTENSAHDKKEFTNAFYYNTLLRSKAFMDVYGISDSENRNGIQLGGQSRWGLSGIGSGILAQKNYNLTNEIKKKIQDSGYSVAYEPVSGGNDSGKTVAEVHGYSDTATGHRLKLDESGKMQELNDASTNISGNEGGLVTQNVSQVNKGQITSYPYNINEGEFTGVDKNGNAIDKNGFVYTGDTASMKVSWTHAQWYQLNTNADNIVVWYTVENQHGDLYGYNDCINNYYIYNCGNITYTGAGHDDSGWDITEQEAKLFVNTMLAAFRASLSTPTAKFVENENSEKAVDQVSIQVETDTVASGNDDTENQEETDKVSKAVNNTKLFFKINDNSISKKKTNGIYLYNKVTSTTNDDGEITYTCDDSDKIDFGEASVYDAVSGQRADFDNLKSGKVYYFTLPTSSQAYNDLVIDGKTSSDIWLMPYNKVNGVMKRKGDPVKMTISLTKSGLFTLG